MHQGNPTTEFHVRRQRFIGGSDVASVLGVPGAFHSPLAVALEKRGELPSENLGDDDRVWLGTVTEQVNAAMYTRKTGTDVLLHTPECVVHPSVPILGCHPDGVVIDGSRRAAFEAKWIAPDQRYLWEAGPPLKYLLQAQHNAGVMLSAGAINEPLCYLSVIFGGCEWEKYEVELDDEWWSAWLALAPEWWERHVVQRIDPDLTAEDLDTVKRRFPKDSAREIELAHDVEEIDRELVEVKATLSALDNRKDELEAVLRGLIGDASIARLPNGVRYTCKTVNRGECTVAASSYRPLRRYAAK